MIWTTHADLGKMDCFGMTDKGHVRRVNSDQFLIADLKRSLLIHRTSLAEEAMSTHFGNTQAQLLMVADGVGEELGLEASTIAVDVISDYLLNSTSQCPTHDRGMHQDVFRQLETAVYRCRTRMQSEVVEHPDRHHGEMGTTVTMAYISWPRVFITHAGDSRCYLYRDSRLRQLTTDHTFAQRLVKAGILEADQLAASRWNNVLWNVVGPNATTLQPEISEHELRIGDALLLCTDGLTKQISERQICGILQQDLDAEATCRKLIDATLNAGGRDNATIILARFRSVERVQEQLEALAELPEPGIEPPAIEEFFSEAADSAALESPEAGAPEREPLP
jgi:protein phosphatase